jgi:hypothetical protein
MPTSARDHHGGTCSFATIRLTRLSRAMPDGGLRRGIDGRDRRPGPGCGTMIQIKMGARQPPKEFAQ